MKVETEKKYYCLEPDELIKIANILNFRLISKEDEIDEYFTDINSEFIKNRTCLRIRKTNNETMEITYKGKSNSLLGLFCKVENNIKVNINEYDNYIKLFTSLGYYSYVEVVKQRLTYTKEEKDCKYSIMIDNLNEIGGFVEFEIISEQNRFTKEQLKQKLDEFVQKFSSLNLNEATKPYRDIVANYENQKLIGNKEISNLCINLDSELLKYEKDFFKKYKDEISKIFNSNIKWTEYKKNSNIDSKINSLVDEYFDNLIFDSKELLVTIELLKQIPYEKYFFTKANETFCKSFFNKLNIETNNILYIKNNETIISLFNKNNLEINKSILINNTNFKLNNSLLLIVINN